MRIIASAHVLPSTRVHGNAKKVGELPVEYYKQLVASLHEKRHARNEAKAAKPLKGAALVRELVRETRAAKGTPYMKVLIEGNTGIYYASPMHGHKDYNKTRVMDKTPYTLRLMEIFNKAI